MTARTRDRRERQTDKQKDRQTEERERGYGQDESTPTTMLLNMLFSKAKRESFNGMIK